MRRLLISFFCTMALSTLFCVTALVSSKPTLAEDIPSYTIKDIGAAIPPYVGQPVISRGGEILLVELNETKTGLHLRLLSKGKTIDAGDIGEFTNISINDNEQIAVILGHGNQTNTIASMWNKGKWTKLPPVKGYKDTSALAITDTGKIFGLSHVYQVVAEHRNKCYITYYTSYCLTA